MCDDRMDVVPAVILPAIVVLVIADSRAFGILLPLANTPMISMTRAWLLIISSCCTRIAEVRQGESHMAKQQAK
jgi:hypothetical protein